MTATIASSTVAQRAALIIESGPDSVTHELLDSDPTLVLHLARRYVADRHRANQRREVVKVESETRRKLRRSPEQVKRDILRSARREAWRLLLEERFSLPDGHMVTWGAASIDEHEARIQSQTDLAKGIMRDVDLHTAAVADLAAFGVSSLDEL